MKRLSCVFAILAIMSAANLSLAHEGHEHAAQLNQATAVETAGIKIKELISDGEITAKWATKTPSTAELVRVDGLQNWVVSYMHEESKERLQLIFTTTGEYVSMTQSDV